MALPQLDLNAPDFTRRYVNLADARLGAQALACSDDFFAEMSRMLNPEPAVFVPGKYDQNGKWMDGWESRRKRGPGQRASSRREQAPFCWPAPGPCP